VSGVIHAPGPVELALACERFRDGVIGQPANSVTSLAFVVAAAAIVVGRRGAAARRRPYALLVAAVGVGSWVQHGPHPPWQAYAHDLPLAAVLAFVAVDAAADLAGRRRSALWWLVPTAAMVPVVAAGPAASRLAQGGLAVLAVGLNLVRARARPALRPVLISALVILGAGALAGSLTDRTELCQPASLLQGHAVWHVLAAVALWRLAPAVGVGSPSAPLVLRGRRPGFAPMDQQGR
jgi:hypothetical protein